MTRSHHKRALFFLLLALLIAAPVGLTWRQVRQEQLNRALIAAIKAHQNDAALTLLNRDADANAHEAPEPVGSFWQCLIDLFQRHWVQRPTGPSALLFAITQEDRSQALIRRLLQLGANPNTSDEEDTPLGFAVDERDHCIADMLLNAGANPNSGEQFPEGGRPLSAAAGSSDEEMVVLLLKKGADAAYRDCQMGRESADGNDGSAMYAAEHELMWLKSDADDGRSSVQRDITRQEHIICLLKAAGAKP